MAQSPSTISTMPADTRHDAENPGPCHLSSLPPEIRNYIYELAFTVDDNTDFLTAKPPSKALCLTSRAIHKETETMYGRVYRNFWETTAFTIDLRACEYGTSKARLIRKQLRGVLDGVSDGDIEHIMNFQFKQEWETFKLQRNGVWRMLFITPERRIQQECFFFADKYDCIVKANGYYILPLIEGYRALVAPTPSSHSSTLDSAAIEGVKKLTGKVALEKGEVLTMAEWLMDSSWADECDLSEDDGEDDGADYGEGSVVDDGWDEDEGGGADSD